MKMIIKTERLIIRPPEAKDLENVSKGIAQEDVAKWLAHVPNPYDIEDSREYIAYANDPRSLDWVVEYQEQAIGCIGINDHLGYWITPTYWGQGIMSEALSAVISNHFAAAGSDDLISGYISGNEQSKKILVKFGFRPTGRLVSLFDQSTTQASELVEMKLTQDAWKKQNLKPKHENFVTRKIG